MSTQIGPEEKPWFYDIKRFIEERKYPEEANSKEKYALHVLAAIMQVMMEYCTKEC